MKKRVLALLLCCCLFMSLSGCGEAKRYQEALELMAGGDYAAAGGIFGELGDYRDSAEQWKLAQTEQRYAAAAETLDKGEYGEARELFTALGDFRDSADMALECLYREASALREQGSFEEAARHYEELGDYRDSAELVPAVRYELAETLLQSGRYDRAATVLRELGDYLDCPQKLSAAEEILQAQYQISQADPGSIVYFGRYEQDGDAADGPEDLAWILLDRQGDKALLLCRDGIDYRRFHEDFVSCGWDSSTLRTWLNGEFLETAFTDSERPRILNSLIEAEDNARYGTSGGGESVSAVFLLSAGEAETYLTAQTAATLLSDAAEAKDDRAGSFGGCCWWLRTPGYNARYRAYVDRQGAVSYEGMYCDNRHFAVRPALWLALSDEAAPEETPEISAPAPLPEDTVASPLDLQESVDMGPEYINNVIFIGDSTTYGLVMIGMPSWQIWTGMGNTLTLYEQSYIKIVCSRSPYKQATIREAAETYKPDMMIITLGMRRLSLMNEELFKSEYRDMVMGIQEVSPDTKIILNSIFPVSVHLDRTVVDFTNEMVSTTNGWVHDIAEELGLRYMDSYSHLLDENGYMVASYAGSDGLHMIPKGLNVVIENYRTHAYN